MIGLFCTYVYIHTNLLWTLHMSNMPFQPTGMLNCNNEQKVTSRTMAFLSFCSNLLMQLFRLILGKREQSPACE